MEHWKPEGKACQLQSVFNLKGNEGVNIVVEFAKSLGNFFGFLQDERH